MSLKVSLQSDYEFLLLKYIYQRHAVLPLNKKTSLNNESVKSNCLKAVCNS